MNRRKRLLCAAASCSILAAMVLNGFAENLAETPLPIQDPVDVTSAPSTEPDPVPEPSTAPTALPTAEPSSDPVPTAEPVETPSPTEPAESPGPTEEPDGQFAIHPPEGAQKAGEIWQIPCRSDEDPIEFEWTAVEGAEGYRVSVRDGQDGEIMSVRQQETAASLPASMFEAEVYALIVQAIDSDGRILAQASLQFVKVQGTTEPGGRPGGFHGGFSGGFAGGAAGGEVPEEEEGFRVTPGEALTDSHSSGDRDMRLYGTVDVDLTEESMTLLTLGGTCLDVTLDGQSEAFFAAQEDQMLILTPETAGERWSVNLLALEILRRSGIDCLCLTIGDSTVEIPTDWTPQGEAYGKLRAEGYVSKDFALTVTEDAVCVAFGGEEYEIEWIGG